MKEMLPKAASSEIIYANSLCAAEEKDEGKSYREAY